MPLMDEFKAERDEIKKAPFKVKMQYFWDYYKWHTIAIIAIVWIVVSLVHTILTKKEIEFYVAIINGVPTNQKELFIENLNELFEIDVNKQEVQLDSGYIIDETKYDQQTTNQVQKISIYISASDVDNVVADSKCFTKYAYLGTFADLNQCLSTEQKERYQDAFFYIDEAIVEKQKTMREEQRNNSLVLDYPDPTKPELMEKPIPVGIYVSGLQESPKTYAFVDEHPAVGIVKNTERMDKAIQFIDAWYNFTPEGEVYVPAWGE